MHVMNLRLIYFWGLRTIVPLGCTRELLEDPAGSKTMDDQLSSFVVAELSSVLHSMKHNTPFFEHNRVPLCSVRTVSHDPAQGQDLVYCLRFRRHSSPKTLSLRRYGQRSHPGIFARHDRMMKNNGSPREVMYTHPFIRCCPPKRG